MEREAIFISLGRVSFSGETMVIEYLVSLTLGIGCSVLWCLFLYPLGSCRHHFCLRTSTGSSSLWLSFCFAFGHRRSLPVSASLSLPLGNFLSVGSLPRPVRAACDFVVCSCLLPRLHNLSVILIEVTTCLRVCRLDR